MYGVRECTCNKTVWRSACWIQVYSWKWFWPLVVHEKAKTVLMSGVLFIVPVCGCRPLLFPQILSSPSDLPSLTMFHWYRFNSWVSCCTLSHWCIVHMFHMPMDIPSLSLISALVSVLAPVAHFCLTCAHCWSRPQPIQYVVSFAACILGPS